MKFSSATTALTMALAGSALAAPQGAGLETRTGPGGSVCNNNQKQVCCTGGLLCLVQILTDNCSGTAYCCDTSESTGGLVNINALNCLKLL